MTTKKITEKEPSLNAICDNCGQRYGRHSAIGGKCPEKDVLVTIKFSNKKTFKTKK